MRPAPLRRIPLLLLPLCLLASGVASAQIELRLDWPAQTLIESDFEILVSVQSVYQLSSMQAEFGGKVFPMPVDLRPRAILSIDGVPYGEHLLTVTARDIHGTEARVSRLLQVDRPPRLTISTPASGLVLQPSIRLTASCEDDHPQGCEVRANFEVVDPRGTPGTPLPGPPSLSAKGRLDQELCLAEYAGKWVRIRLRALSGSQSSSEVVRSIYVENSRRLVPVVSVPGSVIDFDAQRVLFVDEQRRARVLDRTSGQIDTLLENLQINSYICGLSCNRSYDIGHLMPGGAILGTRNMELLQVQDGQRSSLAEFSWNLYSPLSRYYRITGSHLAYFEANQRWGLLNFSTGTRTSLPSEFAANWLGEDGTLLGSTRNLLLRYRNEQVEQVFAEAEGTVKFPIAEGDDQVYLLEKPNQVSETVLLRAGQRHVLSDTPGSASFLLSKGWVAFTRLGGGVNQVWLRSPAGVEEQVSSWGLPSAPVMLGPDGTVVYVMNSQYYLAGPGSPSVPVAGTTANLLKWMEGRPHLVVTDTVFRMEREPSTEPLTCPPAPPSEPSEPSEPAEPPALETPKGGGCAAAGSGSAWMVALTLLFLMTRRAPSLQHARAARPGARGARLSGARNAATSMDQSTSSVRQRDRTRSSIRMVGSASYHETRAWKCASTELCHVSSRDIAGTSAPGT
ncbi:hypothetical protein [Hyalangium minutum]|uniref:Uncharacterized protein n=1 Tax=Hyalangium minutum TaxID=394096 RepID=A0A085W8I6_9BACT|nr:hypothetical protein [Hyalangium minutum]KFE63999.1 hypothetical protein DB31_2411 [Hyalangium minutum]